MAGFLQKDAAGDTMAEQSWGQLADVSSVLQRLDIQLQKKFEKVDMQAEEHQVHRKGDGDGVDPDVRSASWEPSSGPERGPAPRNAIT